MLVVLLNTPGLGSSVQNAHYARYIRTWHLSAPSAPCAPGAPSASSAPSAPSAPSALSAPSASSDAHRPTDAKTPSESQPNLGTGQDGTGQTDI